MYCIYIIIIIYYLIIYVLQYYILYISLLVFRACTILSFIQINKLYHNNYFDFYSNGETLTHLLKASLGTGILAMPQAFQCSGLITGIFATVFVSFVCTFCSYSLVSARMFEILYNTYTHIRDFL